MATKQKYLNDNSETEFSGWLREQKEIDSNMGYVTTNLDFIWHNYKTGDFMLIEEKRFMGHISFSQKNIFKMIDQSIKNIKYRGFYLLQFEKTCPESGEIFLNGKEIYKGELILFLRFELEKEFYQSYFKERHYENR